jgi:hypothetical protein
MSRLLKVFVPIVCVVLACSVARAQKEAKRLAPFQPVEKALSSKVLSQLKTQTRDVDVAPPSGGGIKDLTDLQKMLDDLGYEPKLQDYMGYKYITVTSGGWYVDIEYLADSGNVFINIWLPKIDDLAAMTQAKLLGLMEWNNSFSTFFYSSKGQELCCASWLEGKLMTKAALRKRIDAVAGAVANTRGSWETPK